MITNSGNDVLRREESLRLAVEVLKAQPGLIRVTLSGKEMGDFLTTMADVFLTYVMPKHPPKEQ